MRFRLLATMMFAFQCASLSGCSAGGSSRTNGAAAIPAEGTLAVVRAPRSDTRRTLSVPSCSGTGTGAFVGGGFENVADGAYSGVLEGNSNEACDEESSVAGGYYNFISSGANTSYYSFIGSGYDNSISGNGYQSVIGGGNVNALTAPNAVIGGGNQNTLSGSDSVIAGGSQNTVSSGGTYGFIGGGANNALSGGDAVIAGGSENTNAGPYAFVGGGASNTVSAMYGGVVSGANNKVTTYDYGFIGGGYYNTVSGEGAVATGGYSNEAKGTWSTIPGGVKNITTGEASFAAGVGSYAATTGAFVWSDDASGATQLKSTVANQFLARASGGVTFWTNATNTVGATLAAGSGTWASASDRNLKTNVARIDDAAVLEKVAALPIERWSYKSERGVRHVGPMAQDFYAAFKVGEDDKHITSIDEDGVALAAIKALHARVGALGAENGALRAHVGGLDAENARLRRDLAAERAHDRRVDAELAHIVGMLRK
jgi:hypothetical protein